MKIRGFFSYFLTPNIVSILTVAFPLTLLTACGSTVPPETTDHALENIDVSELKMTMLTDIASTVFSDMELDTDVKSDIAKLAITPLRKNPEIQLAGDDSITRPVAVSLQKAFEQSVLNMVDEDMVSEVAAIIHTRKPTTPLCNPPGEALPETMHPDMKCDPKRCKTIQDRTVTLRQMASHGPPVDLYIAYLEDGLEKRSSKEQNIYREEVNNKNNKSLHDSPMSCSSMPDDIVGASYILKTRRGNDLYFGNNGTQAIDGKGDTIWSYWFGSLKDAPVGDRYNEVIKYLQGCGMDIKI